MDHEANLEGPLRTGYPGKRLTGARAVGCALVESGVRELFGVHGYINSAVEEACRLGTRMWHFRHEQSAGFAADAYARTLRKPGVCFASASAGMANYLGALSQAYGALSPMVLLVGQHGTAGDRLGILQEGYAEECFRSVAKWTKRCTDWELNGYWVRKALFDAMSWPPGPVVLEFPLNNLWAHGPQPQRKYAEMTALPAIPLTQSDPARIRQAAEVLRTARKPLLLAGDGAYWSDAGAAFTRLAELLHAPAGARRAGRGLIDENHPLAVASAWRRKLLDEADVVCLVGLRAGELESWFEAPDWPRGKLTVQIAESPQELWFGQENSLFLTGSPRLVLEQLHIELQLEPGAAHRAGWVESLRSARAEDEGRRAAPQPADGPIDTKRLCRAIAECVPEDATIVYDSYSGSIYLTDFIRARFAGQVLDAGPRVALGQGVGMALGAAVARPGKPVVALVGDGGIGLSGMDLETLARHHIPATIIVLNNGSWGGGSLAQADLQPDMPPWDMTADLRYDQVFEPLGCHVERVESASALEPALRRAFACGRTALVDVKADTEGTGVSLPWLRLKIGEFYSRGIDDLPPQLRRHFAAVSPMEALRLHKSAADNGTQIPLSFMAELTGHPEPTLRSLAAARGYVV